MQINKKITFLGAGSMAEAIIGGLISRDIVAPHSITAANLQDQKRLNYIKETYKIKTQANRLEATDSADIIILAMKPKNFHDAISHIKHVISKDQLIVSVIAGIPTSQIEETLGEDIPVIRTMPNTSAKVGESASAICRGKHATDAHLFTVETLFNAIGTVSIVEEAQMDAVTGIAGSGPAYFYYMIEAMEKAGCEAGLSEEQTHELVRQTIIGVGKRLQNTSKSPKELYQEVMSPGGTTEAGIHTLAKHHFQETVQEAVGNAVTRSKELGQSLPTIQK
ncbi:pyrroline-5-carboxylate reductase [Alkalicoccobacillus porphyridii]|uniref:Pyrroline-5-carboxylate reductase n=1 Tax=Alkalicoccobacillus porphyridii TaxID=2597270 RepID=A0A553ZYY4_9BACI|nr:pyrroline-5-carboxylate reductase [Alkalicoccobacillus porphyridii]TSB46654.1 pyrroline-5-carboxylate reductase [Alkalicoccobacillus porphyridii]